MQRSATIAWGSATAADGSRVRISPIGLSRVAVSSDATTGASCRWWPEGGDAALCATAAGGERAFANLRRAYPLLSVALWTAVVALFLQVLRIPRLPGVRAGITWMAAACCGAAVLSVVIGAQRALAVLIGRPVAYLTPGSVLVMLAMVLAVTSGWLQLSAPRPDKSADGTRQP
jgi:hypothetical protein